MTTLSWIERGRLHGLHYVCRIALRTWPPLRAKLLVDRMASRLPHLHGVEAARAAVLELSVTGSCLSRALTIAAAMPSAEVVVGIDSLDSRGMTAHAWLAIGDAHIDTSLRTESLPAELARFPRAGCSL